jgi:hypothetical protein
MAITGSFGSTSANTLTVTSISELPSQRLSELIDVDTSLRQDGSIIMWDTATGTYKVRPDVDNAALSVIGGSF